MMYLQEQFQRQRFSVDAETVPVNTSFLIINKDAFLLRCKLGKTIISIRTVYHYAHPNYSSHQTLIL